MARVGVDIDGVIFPFVERFGDFVAQAEGQVYPPPTRWDFFREWGKDRAWFDWMHGRFVRAGGYTKGELIGGEATRQALRRLQQAGHQVVLVTARHTFPEQADWIRADTLTWLRYERVLYHELHFASDKSGFDLDYMLDDRWQTFEDLMRHEIESFLYTQPWNEEVSTLFRADSVADYVDIVLRDQAVDAAIVEEFREHKVVHAPTFEDRPDPWANEREDVLARFAEELAKATGDGSKKRQAGEKPPWYADNSHEGAIFSHLTKWKRGEQVDPDSGAHPLVHAAWRCLAIACSESGNYPKDKEVTA